MVLATWQIHKGSYHLYNVSNSKPNFIEYIHDNFIATKCILPQFLVNLNYYCIRILL